MHPGFAPGMLIEKGKQVLGLTDDQVRKIKDLQREHQVRMIKLRGEVELAELDLCTALESDDISKSKIESLADKVSGSNAKIEKERLGFMVDAFGVLNKDQRQKARALMQDRKHGKKDGQMECKGAGMKGHDLGGRCPSSPDNGK